MDSLVKTVDSFGMNAVALTDWGNLYGALYFHKAVKEYSQGRVKPIYGMELGVTVDGTGPFQRHVVLLAENFEGWKNLCKLTSLAHTVYGLDGEVLRPHVPLDELLKHKEGLIFLTGGLKGILNSFILQEQEQSAKDLLKKLKDAVGANNLFLELQDSSLSLQKKCNEVLLDWSREFDLPVVATEDVHYLTHDDAYAQEIWMMVSQKITLEEAPTTKLAPREHFLRSPEEMKDAFSHIPSAIQNTVVIANRCNVKLSFTDKDGKRIFHLPDFSAKDQSQEDLFAILAIEGLENRIAKFERKLSLDERKVYDDRIKYEVDTIIKMGFAGYYLIVSDFIRWAKSHEIPVGPGRGSGVGSLAAYVLDITDLDPIEHGLLFERFLNPERVSLPDFDVDFCQENRHRVIEYVAEKYGNDRVCQIVTFAKEQSKNALKDVGRVLGMSFGETNRLTKLIPSVMAKPLTIEETLEQVEEFRNLRDQDPKIRQCVELALKIEGALRQPGVHAAGVVIASKPIADLAPMSRELGGGLITQWDMKISEEAGLVKFDFLGLVTLDLMDLACHLINKRAEDKLAQAAKFNLNEKQIAALEVAKNLKYFNIPLHDPRSYEILGRGDTVGVFQLESSGMQNLCQKLRPDRFGDVCAINALFRPGPLQSGMVDDFINRKHGRAKVEVMFPEMEPILRETYGVILYQEQVMEIPRQLCGYTLGGADLLRRAMGKKNVKEMDAQRATFVDGAVKNSKDAKKASELFDLIEKFAGYGFNKSHAAAYAALAVQTAFLKAVFPTEFFTAFLTIEKEDTEKLARYIQDARVRGMKILPPDVSESQSNFAIVDDGIIRFGLSAIKNVGESAVEGILAARLDGGAFKDIFDFLSRVDIKRMNSRMLESLLKAGALDTLAMDQTVGAFRAKNLANVDRLMEWATKNLEQKEAGQFSLFGDSMGTGAMSQPHLEETSNPPTTRQMLEWEKELLGIYISGSPLDRYMDRAKQIGATAIFDLKDKNPESQVTLVGLVAELREVRVKKGRRAGEMMGILKIEDVTGQIEMVSFPDHYKEFAPLFKSSSPLVIRAKLDFEEDKPKLMCGEIQSNGQISVEDLSLIEEKWPKRIQVDLNLTRFEGVMNPEHLYIEMAKLLKKYPGTVPVEIHVLKSGAFKTIMELGENFNVHPTQELIRDLNGIVAIPGGLKVSALH